MPRLLPLILCLSLCSCDVIRAATPAALAGTEAIIRREYADRPEELAALLSMLQLLRAATDAAEAAAKRAEEAREPTAAAQAHLECAAATEKAAALRARIAEAVVKAGPLASSHR